VPCIQLTEQDQDDLEQKINSKPKKNISPDEIISAINNGAEVHCDGWDTVTPPWDVLPSEYIRFAQKDIEGFDKRSIVNALSNAKRALECQIDSLMLAMGLRSIAKRLNVPKKLELLNDISVIAPPILRKINKHRNEMEHAYTCPDHGLIMDFVDIVSLFLEATKGHIQDRACEWIVDIPKSGSVVVIRKEDGLLITKDFRSGFAREGLEINPGSGHHLALLGAIMRVESADEP